MDLNLLRKKKRVTHIGNATSISNTSKADSSNPVDYVNDIIRGMDPGFIESERKVMSDNYLYATKLKSFENQILMKNLREDNSSFSASGECGYSNTKMKKFLASRQKFPLMAKCQKNLKYLQHNRCIPKQRAHVVELPKSPLKYSKKKDNELLKFNKHKLNGQKYKRLDNFKPMKKAKQYEKQSLNICSSQSSDKLKTVQKSSSKQKMCNQAPPSSLCKDSHNLISNKVKEVCPNSDSSDCESEFENFIKMHIPSSKGGHKKVSSKYGSKFKTKKKINRSFGLETVSKNVIKKSNMISGNLSSSETDFEIKKDSVFKEKSGHLAHPKFPKQKKISLSSTSDSEIHVSSEHKLKSKSKIGRKKKIKSDKCYFFKDKGSIILQEDIRKECSLSESIDPTKSQKKHLDFDYNENLSPESSCGSVNLSQTFECDKSTLTNESTSDVKHSTLEKKPKRKKLISKERRDNSKRKMKLFAMSSTEEELFLSDTCKNNEKKVKYNLKLLKPCSVVLKRYAYLDNLDPATSLKMSKLNLCKSSKKNSYGLDQTTLIQEHSEGSGLSDELCSPMEISLGNESIHEQAKCTKDGTSIQISGVCSLATVLESDVIEISDSSDIENCSCHKSLDCSHKMQDHKNDKINSSVISKKHNYCNCKSSNGTEFCNIHKILVKEQNETSVDLSCCNKVNKNGTMEKSELSDEEIIEIKSTGLKSSEENATACKEGKSIKAAAPIPSISLGEPCVNISVEQHQLKGSNSLSIRFSEQNASNLPGHKYMPPEVDSAKGISSENSISSNEATKFVADCINSAKSLHMNKGFQNDSKCTQNNLDSDDDCVILQEKIVTVYSPENSNAVLSDKNPPQLSTKTSTNVNDDEQMKLKPCQLGYNSLWNSGSKSNKVSECNETSEVNLLNDEKSKRECLDSKNFKNESSADMKHKADQLYDSLGVTSNTSEIKWDNFAPELNKLKKMGSCPTCHEEFRMENDEISSSLEQDNIASEMGISNPSLKNLISKECLDETIDDMDLMPFVSADMLKQVKIFNAAKLYKLYQQELINYNEIKRTEKNVEVGLRLLEKKQMKKIKQIAYILKVYASIDPCFQNICNSKMKQEKNETVIDEVGTDCNKIDGGRLNHVANEQFLSNTCAKFDTKLFDVGDPLIASCGSNKSPIHCHSTTNEAHASDCVSTWQESFQVNSSASLPVTPSTSIKEEPLFETPVESAVKSTGIKDDALSIKNFKHPASRIPIFNPDLKEKKVQELLYSKCIVCRKQGLFTCQGCQKFCFCSQNCGRIFWDTGHKLECF